KGEGDPLYGIDDLALLRHEGAPALLVRVSTFWNRLMHVDIPTGNRTVFSEPGVRGSGPAFASIGSELLTGETDDAIWVIDQAAAGADGVMRVDPATGDRLPVHDETLTVGAGPDI